LCWRKEIGIVPIPLRAYRPRLTASQGSEDQGQDQDQVQWQRLSQAHSIEMLRSQTQPHARAHARVLVRPHARASPATRGAGAYVPVDTGGEMVTPGSRPAPA